MSGSELFFDRGQCQGQVTRRISQPRAGDMKGGKPAEPGYYLDVQTPGGLKKFRCKPEDHHQVGDGDVVLCDYEVKSFVDDKTGASKEYQSLIRYEVVLPGTAIAKLLERAAANKQATGDAPPATIPARRTA